MFNLAPAKILSYDAAQRTAQVHIDGLTDGAGFPICFSSPSNGAFLHLEFL